MRTFVAYASAIMAAAASFSVLSFVPKTSPNDVGLTPQAALALSGVLGAIVWAAVKYGGKKKM